MPIVLVHGAWTGAWSWRDAARLLRKEGYDVYAPTLTGLAERSHVPPERVTLNTHIADIAGLLRYEDLENVLIVGHSYGGMVVTGAADQEIGRIAGMIYVDAFLPQSNQSLWDIVGPEQAEAQWKVAQAHDGGKSVPRPNIPSRGDAPVAKWGSMFTPQPIGCMTEKFVSVRAPEQRTWPRRHYVLCAAYKGSAFQLLARQVRDDPQWEYSEFDAMHDVVRSDPALTASRILDVARRWGINE